MQYFQQVSLHFCITFIHYMYEIKQGFHWAFNYVHIYLGASIFLTSD